MEVKRRQANKVRTTVVEQHKGEGKTAAKTAPETVVVGLLKVSHRQTWTDLLAAGLARENLMGGL